MTRVMIMHIAKALAVLAEAERSGDPITEDFANVAGTHPWMTRATIILIWLPQLFGQLAFAGLKWTRMVVPSVAKCPNPFERSIHLSDCVRDVPMYRSLGASLRRACCCECLFFYPSRPCLLELPNVAAPVLPKPVFVFR